MSSIALPSDDSISSLSTLKTEAPFPRPISTGPRSPEGKSRSSQNARKHNLSSSTPPPSLLANATYQLSLQEFKEEFNPITPAQSILVKELNFISWKLAQIPHLEHQLQATSIGQYEPAPLDPKPTPQDYTPANDPTNQITATHLLQNQPTPLTRLWDHHRRLLARFQSVVRQIHTLQKQEEQKAQNEAQGESDRERSRRIAQEQSAFDDITHQMHQKLKQKQEEARHHREQQVFTPSPGTPEEGRGGRGEGSTPNTTPTPLAQPAQKSLAVSRIENLPLAHPQTAQIAPAQNELPQPPQSQISNPKISNPIPPAQNELPPISNFKSQILLLLTLLLLSPTARAAHPLMRDFMGLNVHTVQFQPTLYAPVCRLLRDYHPMEWDVGKDTSHATTFPGTTNGVDWDQLYGKWTKSGYEVDACVMFDSLPAASWKDPAADARTYGQSFAKYFGPSNKATVTSVEIGNEPAKYTEKQYRPIFEAMAKGLRAGDPKIKIATCAVMTGKPDQWSKPMSAVAGLEDLYDILNVHSYAFKDHWPTWRRSYPEDPKIVYLKEIQSVIDWRNDHAKGKQVWLTEFGYDSSTKTPDKTGQWKDWVGVTDLQQAQYTVRSFLVLSSMDVDRAYLYFFNDKDEPQLHGASGITRNFKPKPAFHAMAHLYKTLGDYQFAKAIRQQEDLYCYEYDNPTKPNEKIYVAWSPTGQNKLANKVLPIPHAIDRAEQMPTEKGEAPQIKTKPTEGGVQAEITETPIYLWTH